MLNFSGKTIKEILNTVDADMKLSDEEMQRAIELGEDQIPLVGIDPVKIIEAQTRHLELATARLTEINKEIGRLRLEARRTAAIIASYEASIDMLNTYVKAENENNPNIPVAYNADGGLSIKTAHIDIRPFGANSHGMGPDKDDGPNLNYKAPNPIAREGRD